MSSKLADALRLAGFEALAVRAELDEFHPTASPHDLPDIMLYMELLAIIKGECSQRMREAARLIRRRHMLGEFDDDSGRGLAAHSAGSFTQVERMALDAG